MKTLERNLVGARSSPVASCLLDTAGQVSDRTTQLCDEGAPSFGMAIRQALDASMARCLESGSPHPLHEARLAVARDVLARLDTGEFEAAAERLAPPHDRPAEERPKELELLRRSIEIVARELGHPSEASPVDRFEGGHAEVGSGLLEEWRGFPERLVSFEVWYSREGPGFLTCRFVLTDRGWELGALVFSLPSTRPDAQARMAEISGVLLRELAPEM